MGTNGGGADALAGAGRRGGVGGWARRRGLELTGPNGLLKLFTKNEAYAKRVLKEFSVLACRYS
jgi:hypothetical protein